MNPTTTPAITRGRTTAELADELLAAVTISITPEERSRGRLDASTLERALGVFREHGFVVVARALSPDHVEVLRAQYQRDLGAKVARSRIRPVTRDDPRRHAGTGALAIDFAPEGGNHDFNRWNMQLPSTSPYIEARLIASPFVQPVIDEILGDDCILNVIASDTPDVGSGFQGIHQDAPSVAIVVNIPLVDVGDDNAPIEVWPRSHRVDPWSPTERFSHESRPLVPEQIDRLSERLPSVRLCIPAGSAVIRDKRMLHRGTANRSSERRPMLTMQFMPAPAQGRGHAGWALWIARQARSARVRARETGLAHPFQVQHHSLGNHIGRQMTFLLATDRHGERAIPVELWRDLTDRARRSLRFAMVADGRTHGGRPSMRALRAQLKYQLELAAGECRFRWRSLRGRLGR